MHALLSLTNLLCFATLGLWESNPILFFRDPSTNKEQTLSYLR